ncbi:RagB/SusD family nutrient uptake outer membrane protein [Paraflavitalea speifideaquila]|uniref:RagB/SusD family nutrient uptake outer membrane protein n=1 Tax=Paraflavitalea speifideaquila TaxID=3076558 RepID=UPI003CCDEDB1
MICDEAEAGPAYLGTNAMNFGSMDASNTLDNVYAAMYTRIRRTNVLLSYRDLMTFAPTAKAQFVAQAQTLRAFYYFELLKRYGGVPLVTSPVSFEDIKDPAAQAVYKANLKRASYASIVTFIVQQLDSAAKVLPWFPAPDINRGRTTAAACLGLKAKVLLYAASKLNNNPTPAAAGEPGAMTDELIGYTSYDGNRWKLAADACRDFFTQNAANGNWYSLYNNYGNIFNESRDANNRELIWYRQGTSNTPIFFNPPGRLTGYAHSQMLVNLVDKYEMTNGKMKDEAGSGYDESKWWLNRDPRLAMTVIKSGDTWKGFTMEFWPASATDKIGGDYSDGVVKTGLFFRKFQRPDNNNGVQKWHYLRMAEMYLMLAEAENEMNGPNTEVYNAINAVRARATVNMPGLTAGLTKEAMRNKIRNERAVELSLEAERYFDVRRWMIAEQTDNTPAEGFRVTKVNGVVAHTRYVIENRKFLNRMYLYPIPIAEIYKGADIKQNPGY